MKTKDLMIIILVVVVVGGFYLVLNNIASLGDDVRGLEIAVHLLGQSQAPAGAIISEGGKSIVIAPSASTTTDGRLDDGVVVPTAVIFNTRSSPILQPQANIPIIVESAAKARDGQVVVSVKAFTSEAESYSSIEPRDLFEIVDLLNANQKAFQVNGGFQSMPPKSVITGNVVFKIKPEQKTLILQINAGDGVYKHYEFNFDKKSYKETTIG